MIESTCFSAVFRNCLRFKRGPNFQGWGGKPILQNNWIAWIEGAWYFGRNQFRRTAELLRPSFCISILKVSRTQIHCQLLDFSAFCMIQEYLSKSIQISKNFYGEPILKDDWIIWIPFCIPIFKVLWTQILCPSLDLNAFCMVQEKYFQTFEISTN